MKDHGVPFSEAMKVWARVAALSFGGPAGQIAVMHRIIVEEKKWIGDQRFLQALNYCTLLPGPEAQQLATYIGWLMHRTKGGLLAGTLFVLPGLLAIMALSLDLRAARQGHDRAGPVLRAEGRRAGDRGRGRAARRQARAAATTSCARLAAAAFVAHLLLRRAVSAHHRGRGRHRLTSAARAGWPAFLAGGGHGKLGDRQRGRCRFAAGRGDAGARPAQRPLVALHRRGVPGAVAGAGGGALCRPGRRQCLHPDRGLLQQDGRSSPSAAPMRCWPTWRSRRSRTITG